VPCCYAASMRRLSRALAYLLANVFEIGYGDQTSFQIGVTCFVPVWIVFASCHMKEVAGRKGEEANVGLWIFYLVVVKCSDDLETDRISIQRLQRTVLWDICERHKKCLSRERTFFGGCMASASFSGTDTGADLRSCDFADFAERRNCVLHQLTFSMPCGKRFCASPSSS